MMANAEDEKVQILPNISISGSHLVDEDVLPVDCKTKTSPGITKRTKGREIKCGNVDITKDDLKMLNEIIEISKKHPKI